MTRANEVRHEVRLQLYANGRHDKPAAYIFKIARRQGFDFSESEIKDALFFLCSQKHAEKLVDEATVEVTYRITGPGMLYYETKDEGEAP